MNIILTGGTRGIGYDTTMYLLESGHNLAINYINNDAIAEDIKNKFPNNFIYIKGSITDDFANKKLVDTALYTFGSIDCLINNAGISLFGLMTNNSKEDINKSINTNIIGTINITQLAIPHLLNSQGQIINISSIWGHKGASCETIYAMTKGAINQMTTSLARELGPSGVRVNTISPGLINTHMNDDLELKDFIEEIPLKRMGEGIEIARLIQFLLNSTYINGTNIIIDGGYAI
ncbi:MAG: SDR family oxidoreductase [Firmicutes bacterium]|nr:SDR family oxidoreductase [Bacillota bacterium]